MTNLKTDKTMPWYKTSVFRWVRDSVIALGVFAALSVWQTRNMLSADGSVTIEPMNLVGLDGELRTLFTTSEDEKPTLVYFFAPWCKVCEMSIGNLNAIDTDSVNIVRIALDYGSVEQVEEFAMKTRAEGPILLGNNSTKHQFRVPGYPSYYLLDRDKAITGRSMGYTTEWGMKLNAYFSSAAP